MRRSAPAAFNRLLYYPDNANVSFDFGLGIFVPCPGGLVSYDLLFSSGMVDSDQGPNDTQVSTTFITATYYF